MYMQCIKTITVLKKEQIRNRHHSQDLNIDQNFITDYFRTCAINTVNNSYYTTWKSVAIMSNLTIVMSEYYHIYAHYAIFIRY